MAASALEAALAMQPAAAGAPPAGKPPGDDGKKALPPDPPGGKNDDTKPGDNPATELPISPILQWFVPNAQAALANHSIGNFRGSAPLADALTQDPQIAAALSTRVKAITALKIDWTPADDSPRAKEICAIAQREWLEWLPEQESERFHKWLLTMGCAIAQIVWDRRTTPWKPRFNCWNPVNLYYYWDGERKFGKWQLIYRDGVIEPVGGDGQWIFARSTEKQPWVQGLVRSLTVPFLMRLNAYVAWARLNEKYGLAFLVNEVPMATPDKYVQDAAESLNNLGSESVVTIRQGDNKDNQWKLDFRQINPQAFMTFMKSLEVWATDIATDILGQPSTQTHGRYGSRADTQAKNEIRLDLVRADAACLDGVWNTQLLPQWAATNFGDARLAPKRRYVTDAPDTIDQTAGAASQLITAIAQMMKAGSENGLMPLARVNFNKLFEGLGFPMLPDDAASEMPETAPTEDKPTDAKPKGQPE